MRMIDADALPEHKFPEILCNKFGDGAFYRQGWNDAIDAIVDNEDTVDAIPIEWINLFNSTPIGGDSIDDMVLEWRYQQEVEAERERDEDEQK